MRRLLCVLLILLFYESYAFAVQVAPRITDREIIESLAELKAGQDNLNKRFEEMDKSINRRFEEMDKSINRRFDDLKFMLQIIAGALVVFGGSMLGWLIVIWRRLVQVEEKQKRIEKQDEDVKFLKDAYNKLNDMLVEFMKLFKVPRSVL